MDRLVYRFLTGTALLSAAGFTVLHWIDRRIVDFANVTHLDYD